jgi:hypothetical protein
MEAHDKLLRANKRALALIKLAQDVESQGGDTASLRAAACKELERLLNNDDFVDQLYDEDRHGSVRNNDDFVDQLYDEDMRHGSVRTM